MATHERGELADSELDEILESDGRFILIFFVHDSE